MKTGAIIAAAGIPLSMPDFDPTIMLGDTSIIKKIIITLQQAEVDPIVIVTGYRAELLEKHVSRMGVSFLRNENYMKNDMFHAVCTGIDYLKEECSQIFVMPVDVPLFSQETLHLLMMGSGVAVCPVFDGEKGHPILLKKNIFDDLLNYRGDEGLRGALSFGGWEVEFVNVDDEGVLLELDSEEELNRLRLKAKNHRDPLRYNLQLKIGRDELAFGPGSLQFLELVNRNGSMQTACRQMHISYSKGLKMVALAEKETGLTLLDRHAGGSDGGMSALTPEGRSFISSYAHMREELDQQAQLLFQKYFNNSNQD